MPDEVLELIPVTSYRKVVSLTITSTSCIFFLYRIDLVYEFIDKVNL